VTGVDLVQAQLRIASGEPLPYSQTGLSQRGHAIECRVYAEDPAQEFLPQAGSILLYREPQGPGVRVDSGVASGSDVTVHYDPLIAKLIVWAETRDAARRRAVAALREYAILGIRTNIPFLLRLLEHRSFIDGKLDTGFLDREAAAIAQSIPPPPADVVAAAIQAYEGNVGTCALGTLGTSDPFVALKGWRG
jgi:acetyl/propionyl-CoA carboxylase alpha subunit